MGSARIPALVLLLLAQGWTFAPAQPEPEKHALLVGVTEYPTLREEHGDHAYETSIRLLGPANDAELFAGVLREKFGFPAESTTVLAGWGEDEATRPTRANIEAAFRQLSTRAKRGDQVVILMSGHGAQQPPSDPASSTEIDGMDEIFLPADASSWNEESRSVVNAIVDDEISEWSRAIREKGAFIFVVFDSCHSGTMTRGGLEAVERYRYLGAETLGIPAGASRPVTRTRGGRTPSDLSPEAPLDLEGGDGGLVALYAAQPFEKAPERPLPKGSPIEDEYYHGVLTYAMTQAVEGAHTRITYRELLQRIISTYNALGRREPTPFAEGDLDLEVFGVRNWPERSLITIRRQDKGLELTQGSLLGLTVDTVLAVYPPAGDADPDRLLGYVRVSRTAATNAGIEPVEYDGRAAPALDSPPDGARCEVAYRDFGDDRIPLAVQTVDDAENGTVTTHAPGALPELWSAAFAELEESAGRFVQLTDDLATARWLMRIEDSNAEAWLMPVEAATDDESDSSSARGPSLKQGPFGPGRESFSEVQELLRKIYKWENLRRLGGQFADDATAPRVEVAFERCRDDEHTQCEPIAPGSKVLHDEKVRVIVRNEKEVVDVTVLLLDSRFGIDHYRSLRLTPRQEPYVIVSGSVDAETTYGQEYLLTIAVRPPNAGGAVADYSWLKQESLEQVVRTRGARSPSPLNNLLEAAAFGVGRSQGLTPRAASEHALHLISWETVPN